MNREFNTEDMGEQLGVESVGSVVTKVEEYCAHETQRIALTNEPRIMALRAEGALLFAEERDLADELRHAPPPGDLRSRRRKAIYYWCVTAALALAGFIFSLVAFDPYRLGWKSYVYSLGIAVVTPFLVEKVLEQWNAKRFFKWLAALACVAALASLGVLAVIRGDLFAEQFKSANPVVTFDDREQPQEPETTFYDRTLVLLRLVMALLAFAMELGAGLALYEAWRMSAEGGDVWERLRHRLGEVRRRLVAITYEITALENEPRIFAARFWRNFYRTMLTHTVRNAMTKLLFILAVALPFVSLHASAADHVTIVVALDLTQSVALTGPNGGTEFAKNVNGVIRLLRDVPRNARITVVGITDASFAQPYILLSASIPDDPGYFGERLHMARNELIRAWKSRTAHLAPRFRYTDVVGALLLAGQLFDEEKASGRKILVLFSDMRHHTRDLDLESPRVVPPVAALQKQSGTVPVAPLRDVQVYVQGVDGAGKSVAYWQSLRKFWAEYFEHSHATLRSYSVLRDLPNHGEISTPLTFAPYGELFFCYNPMRSRKVKGWQVESFVRFRAGDRAPQSGIYRVHHYAHRVSHAVIIIAGTTFPKCKRCGDKVQFVSMAAGEPIDADVDFGASDPAAA